MSNPTTPFSWQMPTATDLVTDLPADFEVFGQAVATSMADLLGGTTGQILSKTSATDMDFTWIANDQGDITGVTAGNGITVTSPTGPVPTVSINTAVTADLTTAQTLTNKTLTSPALTTPTISTLTTNGDLLYGTGSGALARKAIGTTGQVLTVAAGIPSWATPSSSGGMTLLSTTTMSGASTAVSSISQSYTTLVIQIFNITDNGTTGTNTSFRANTGINSGSFQWRNGNASVLAYSNNQLFLQTDAITLDHTTGNNAFTINIENYASTTAYKPFQMYGAFVGSDGSTNGTWASGGFSANTAISSFTIDRTSASFTGGTIKVYGVN